MRKARKKEFVPWQTFVFDITFMYQGILLFVSALLASATFYLAVSFLLAFSNEIYITVIHNGSMITRLIRPIFLLAIIFTVILVILSIFSGPISKLFLLVFKQGKPENDTRSFNVKRRIGMSETNFYAFSIMVYIMWLYSSAVFSLTLRNGTAEYLFIFFSLAILTFEAKKIVAYPVYILLQKQIDAERTRRDKESFVSTHIETSEPINLLKKEIKKDEFPLIFACAEKAFKSFKYRIEKIEISFGSVVDTLSETETSRNLTLCVGIDILTMLDENQIYAAIVSALVKRKNGCEIRLKRFLNFVSSVDFTSSVWNPADRIYFPMRDLLLTEFNECKKLAVRSTVGSMKKYSEKADESFRAALLAGTFKMAVYSFFPFAYSKDFYHPLLKYDSPLPDYHTRLISRFFCYLESYRENIIAYFEETEENKGAVPLFMRDITLELVKSGKADILARPNGAYKEEIDRLDSEFNSFFVMLTEEEFERKSAYLYKNRVAYITEFEKNLLSGNETNTEEKLEAADNYIALMMPRAALDIVSDIDLRELEDNARLNLILGEAKLRLGDSTGKENLVRSVKLNYNYAYFVARIATECKFSFDAKYTGAYDIFSQLKDELSIYLAEEPDVENICFADDITGECKLSSKISKGEPISAAEKNRIVNALLAICSEDRLEWIALVKYTTNTVSYPLIIVKCSEIYPGGYTDSYVNGVYIPERDILDENIRIFGDKYYKKLVVRAAPNAMLEAFDELDDVIIYSKGQMHAEKILSKELASFLDENIENEFIDFDIDGENEDEDK